METISREQLRVLLEADAVVPIEALPAAAYAAGPSPAPSTCPTG
ncbi:hypothetical protein [Planomonospora sp. ID67723]|nr:hypothetical protein [Planomonospora sp. ID67723]